MNVSRMVSIVLICGAAASAGLVGAAPAGPGPTSRGARPTTASTTIPAAPAIQPPATAPASKPTEVAEVRRAQRTLDDLRKAAALAADRLTEFEAQRAEQLKKLQQEQAKLEAERKQLPPGAIKRLPGDVLDLRTQVNQLSQDSLEDRRLLLKLRSELAQRQMQVAEGRADLKTRQASLAQILRAVSVDAVERANISASNAADKLDDLKKQSELAKSEVLAGEKLLTGAGGTVEDWRRRRDLVKASLSKDVSAAKDTQAADLVRERLRLLDEVVSLSERHLAAIQDHVGVRREIVAALQEALGFAGQDLDFRRQFVQQVKDQVGRIRAKEAAQAVEAEQAAQARRSRRIHALREQLEKQKREATNQLAALAQTREAEHAASQARRALWEAQYEAAGELLDTVDRYLELIGAVKQLDAVMLSYLEDRAEAERKLAAPEVSIRQIERDVESLSNKQRSAQELAALLADLPAKARRKALDALREMRSPKLSDRQLNAYWARAFGTATRPATATQPALVTEIRRTLRAPALEDPALPKLLEQEIRHRAEAFRQEDLPPELQEGDIERLRKDYRELAVRPWALRKRQYELAVAQAAVSCRAHNVATEHVAAIGRYVRSFRERRARALWAREEAKVELETVRQAWSDLVYLWKQAGAGIESLPQRMRPLRALCAIGVLVAAIGVGWGIGVPVKRRLQDLRGRVRNQWPGSPLAKGVFAAVRVLGNVHRLVWILAAVIAALGLLGVPRQELGYICGLLGLVAAYRVIRAGVKAVLSPNSRRYRLVPIRGRLARHLNRVVANYLLFALVTAILIATASYGRRPPDELLLIWKLHLVGGFGFMLWLVSHESLLLRVLPRRGSLRATAARRILLLTIYPAMLLLATCWWSARVFGFRNLSLYLLVVLLKTIAAVAVAYGVFLLIARRWERLLRERHGTDAQDDEQESAQAPSPSLLARHRFWVQCAVAVLALALIFRYWDDRIGELGRSEAAPDAVRMAVAGIGRAYAAVKGFYLGRFDAKLGQYTGLPWRLTVATLVILAAWVLSRVIRRAVTRFVFSYTTLQEGSRETILTLIKYVVVGGGTLIGLGKAGIKPSSLAVVSGAFIFGITFGLQDIFRNFVSGILLHFARPIRVGDFVEVGGRRGTVLSIGARSTRILGEDNVAVDVPNGLIAGGNVINWSSPSPMSMLRVPVQVTRDAPVAKVKEIMLDVASRHPLVSKTPPPEVSFQTLAAGMMAFELLVWSQAVKEARRIISELLFQVEAELKKATVK